MGYVPCRALGLGSRVYGLFPDETVNRSWSSGRVQGLGFRPQERGLLNVNGVRIKQFCPPLGKTPKKDQCLGPDNVPLLDLGGNGDCGFRCLVGSNAFRNGATLDKMQEKVAKLALSLRVKAVTQLDENQGSWVLEWLQDPECAEATEDGAVPGSAADLFQACRRPRKWLNPYLTLACANLLLVD